MSLSLMRAAPAANRNSQLHFETAAPVEPFCSDEDLYAEAAPMRRDLKIN
jgi:hypothetical protein